MFVVFIALLSEMYDNLNGAGAYLHTEISSKFECVAHHCK